MAGTAAAEEPRPTSSPRCLKLKAVNLWPRPTNTVFIKLYFFICSDLNKEILRNWILSFIIKLIPQEHFKNTMKAGVGLSGYNISVFKGSSGSVFSEHYILKSSTWSFSSVWTAHTRLRSFTAAFWAERRALHTHGWRWGRTGALTKSSCVFLGQHLAGCEPLSFPPGFPASSHVIVRWVFFAPRSPEWEMSCRNSIFHHLRGIINVQLCRLCWSAAAALWRLSWYLHYATVACEEERSVFELHMNKWRAFDLNSWTYVNIWRRRVYILTKERQI